MEDQYIAYIIVITMLALCTVWIITALVFLYFSIRAHLAFRGGAFKAYKQRFKTARRIFYIGFMVMIIACFIPF